MAVNTASIRPWKRHTKRDRSHRVLVATNDGFSDMFHRSPRTAAALLSQVAILRDTDFGTVVLQSPGADKGRPARP
jgi:hypothetical protein